MSRVEEKLAAFVNNESASRSRFANYSLDGVRALLGRYGNPHEKLSLIHIAGTNGKGSVAYMLSHILAESGFRTGLYTSPHLERVNERIAVNHRMISDGELSGYIDDVLDSIPRLKVKPTYFDVLTVVAFRYFHEKRADLSVIETGLGGRLDSTNVIHPLLSIITDIARDHEHILGRTLRKIAAEKAGIIKPGSPVITSNRRKSVLTVISEKALSAGSPMHAIGKDILLSTPRPEGGEMPVLGISFNGRSISGISLNTPCSFQVTNAALAAAAAMLLGTAGYSISDGSIRSGLGRSRVPGRFAVLSSSPMVIFDPAHNPAAIETLIKSLKEVYPGRRYAFVISVMKDKDYARIFELISRELSASLYYFTLDDGRCLLPGDGRHGAGKVPPRCFSSLQELCSCLKTDIDSRTAVVVTGTFRLYSAAKEIVRRLS